MPPLIGKPSDLFFCDQCHSLQTLDAPCLHLRPSRRQKVWLIQGIWGLCAVVAALAWWGLILLALRLWQALDGLR